MLEQNTLIIQEGWKVLRLACTHTDVDPCTMIFVLTEAGRSRNARCADANGNGVPDITIVVRATQTDNHQHGSRLAYKAKKSMAFADCYITGIQLMLPHVIIRGSTRLVKL